jgi:twitching motility protein PilT
MQYIDCDDHGGLLEAVKNGASDGMQHFDGEIEKLVRSGIVDREIALSYATDAQELQNALNQA